MLLGAIWFGTTNLRTQRAIEFDQQSRTALAAGDLATAYQRERFAYALAPRDERALTLGSLAYLRGNYAAAADHFRFAGSADDGSADGAQTRALVGVAAAAAQTGDQSTFERALKRLGRPGNAGLRLAVADAAIDSGDLERAAELLKNDRPDTAELTFAKALGQAAGDPAAAQVTLAAAKSTAAKPTFEDPAYQRFITQLIAVPRNGGRDLAILLDRTTQESAGVSRTVTLAETLYGFGDYRAAERLARSAVQTAPDYRDGWNALAAAQISLREHRDAERSLKISTDLDSGYGYTWYLRGQLAEASGQKNQAKEYTRRAKLLGYEKR